MYAADGRHAFLFVLPIFLFFLSSSCRSRDDNGKLSPKQLQEDFYVITSHIEKEVPNPYYSCPKARYDALKSEIYAQLEDSMTSIQFYRTVYPLIRTLNDAHFSIKPSDAVLQQSEADSLLFFPFKVQILGDQLFVIENCSADSTAMPGEEIITINGQPVKNMIERLRSCPAENPGEEKFFEGYYSPAFYWWLFILWGYQGHFSLQFRDKRRITVRGVPEAVVFGSSYPKDRKCYSFKILSGYTETIGYINITTLIWDKASRRDSLALFLKETFQTIKRDSIQNLIIDIRNNGGGSSVLAKDIFDYITDDSLKTAIGADYFQNGKRVRNLQHSWYKPKQVDCKFSGQTILLTNAMTYSSAHMLAVAFHHYHMGVIVGQCSAESLYITGEVRRLVLPHTGCTLYYPTANFLLPGYKENKKAHLLPDYQVYPSLADLLHKKDTLLNFGAHLFDKLENEPLGTTG